MNDPELAPELLARLSSREREQHVNAEFFSNLLDQRLYYANTLAPLARHTYLATGIEAGFQYVPQELMDYLPAGNLKGSLSLGFETDIDEAFSLTRFAIDLDDGPQVELTTDWLSTTVMVNGEVGAMYLDP